MKNFTYLLSMMLLMACGQTTASEEIDNKFERHVLGNWEVITPTRAEWLGVRVKAKADTFMIGSTENHSLQLLDDVINDYDAFTLTMKDYTLSNSDEIEIGLTDFKLKYNPENVFLSLNMSNRTSEYIELGFIGSKSCNPNNLSPSPLAQELTISIFKPDSTLLKTLIFDIYGFESVLLKINPCDENS